MTAAGHSAAAGNAGDERWQRLDQIEPSIRAAISWQAMKAEASANSDVSSRNSIPTPLPPFSTSPHQPTLVLVCCECSSCALLLLSQSTMEKHMLLPNKNMERPLFVTFVSDLVFPTLSCLTLTLIPMPGCQTHNPNPALHLPSGSLL